MYLSPKINLLLLVGAIAQVFAIGISFNPARAQSITPANDGTNTQITTNGNQIDIDGGTQAGANLFHSFEKFGLNQNEIANFISGSDIQNILGRITGGNPSVINGLIQVTGGNPNLFLVNPSGIFFGPNATLNVPADFTATTATNIGIGENFFNAFGENSYADLTGSINDFVFSNLQPGSIINSGNLTVSSGSNLNLLGGTVASTGELSGGNITVATVPGEKLLRITPEGQLLSLEIPASVVSSGEISVASLPELLTGSGLTSDTGFSVNNGQVEITASGSSVNTGDIKVGSIDTSTTTIGENAGSVTLQAVSDITTGNIISGVFASNDSAQNGGAVSITSSNGSITTGNINTNSYSSFGSRAGNAGTVTLSAANNISTGNIDTTSIFEGFTFGFDDATGDAGNISITSSNSNINTGVLFSAAYAEEGSAGNGGEINLNANNGSVSTGAIVSATIAAEFGDVGSGGDINISAKGNVDTTATELSSFLGQGYLSDIENIANLSDYDNLTGGLVLSGAYTPDGNVGNSGAIKITSNEGTITTGFIASILGLGEDDTGNGSNINLNAQGDIITDLILSATVGSDETGNGGEINITSRNGNITTGALLSVAASVDEDGDNAGNGGNITVNAENGSITTGALLSATGAVGHSRSVVANPSNGGNITLIAKDDVTVGGFGLSDYANRFDESNQDLDLFAALDDIALDLGFNEGEVNTRTVLNNLDNITSGVIISATGLGDGDVGSGGAIEITSTEGSINTGFTASIAGTGSGNAVNGGNITMTADKDITTGIIFSATGTGDGNTGNGGDISLEAKNGSITTSPLISAAFSLEGSADNGGAITLSAKNDVKVDTVGFSTLTEGIDLGNDVLDSLTALDNFTKGWIISTTVAADGNAGNAGAVNITSTEGTITTGPIASVVYANDGSAGNAGDISLNAKNEISADLLASVSYGSEDDDDVISGKGGNIIVTTESSFRAPETLGNLSSELLDQQQLLNDEDLKSELEDSLEDFEAYSIGSYGRSGSGSIKIEHGGNGDTAFVVGDATENGTAGDIITGGFLDGLSTRIETTEILPGNFTQGKIEVITQTQKIPQEIKNSTEITSDQKLTNNSTSPLEVDTLADEIEETSTQQFVDFSGTTNVEIKTVQDTQGLLGDIGRKTGVKPAAVYTRFLPEKYVPGSSLVSQEKNNDVLNIIIVTAEGKPIRKQIQGATRAKVGGVARRFMRQVSQSRNANSTKYLAPAKQLYDWLIKPYEAEVQQLGIKNLMFVMDPGLRQLPVAALHDGERFVIEKYSVGLLPSLSLTDTRYTGVQNSKVLAMGSSTFTEDQNQNPLPAVSVELPTIAGELWEGKYVSGENFTLDNLKSERANTPYGIIHLATHADFPGGSEGRKQSYIQLYDQKLRLENVRELGWNNPPVELLVLSACRSALGDAEAELGFAGLAVQTGVKSAVASLWFVSDAGTLGMMTEFYRQLSKAPIKAEALRQTQLAMLQGKVRVDSNQLTGTRGNVTLTPEQAEYLRNNINGELSHPYYWASFTMIGSPW